MNNGWKLILRRMAAGVFITVMLFSLSACGSDNGSSSAAGQTIYPDTTSAEPLTIGYTFWGLDFDGFMNDQANQIRLVADALNVKLIFNPNTTDFSAESVVNAAGTFAEEGVDGMVVINFSDESLLEISDICSENQIPFMQATRTISDAAVAKQVESNPYYVGRMHENEYAAAYEVGRKLVEGGATRIIMFSSEHGDVAYEARAEGFRDACEEPTVEIVEEVWGLSEDDTAAEIMVEKLKEHPEVDGIFSARGGFYPYIIKAEDMIGMSPYVPMVGIDMDRNVGDYLENGAMLAVAGGHHADASLTLITLVNAIRGSYDTSVYPIDITYSMMVVDSKESYDEYKYWCLGYDEDYDNRQILNANDARGLCVDYNPATNLTDMTAFAETMSVTGVIERHKAFIK